MVEQRGIRCSIDWRRRSGSRTRRSGRAVGPGAAGRARAQSRRRTPGSGNSRTRRARRHGVAPPDDEAKRRRRVRARPPANRPEQAPRHRRVAPSRRSGPRSCSCRTAHSSHGPAPVRQLSAGPSSGVDAHEAARRPRSRAPCRSGPVNALSDAVAPVSQALARRPPSPSDSACHPSGVAELDVHPSWRRVSPPADADPPDVVNDAGVCRWCCEGVRRRR